MTITSLVVVSAAVLGKALASEACQGDQVCIDENTLLQGLNSIRQHVQPSKSTPSLQCAGIHEAEDASNLEGARVHANTNSPGHQGFTGESFVDYLSSDGAIEWNIEHCRGGAASVSFRYALRGGDRPLKVEVNNQVVQASLSFPPTGSWATWGHSASVQIPLVAGTNKIRLVGTGESGANLDSMTLIPAPSDGAEEYLGCFVDDGARDLGPMIGGSRNGATNTFELCRANCDKRYMSLQYGGECFCADSYGNGDQYVQVEDSECNRFIKPCAVNSHNCGGTWRQAIYEIMAPTLFSPESTCDSYAGSQCFTTGGDRGPRNSNGQSLSDGGEGVDCCEMQHFNGFHRKPAGQDWYWQVNTPGPVDFRRFSVNTGRVSPTFRVDYSDDGTSWSAAASAATSNNMQWDGAGAHQYWRVTITSGSANMAWYRSLQFHTA